MDAKLDNKGLDNQIKVNEVFNCFLSPDKNTDRTQKGDSTMETKKEKEKDILEQVKEILGRK